ncbi:hypothetical protein, partial [Salmonella sp. SAL4436]|uniref:hypothetical protein n=1 Tax=Salmonella sp. SAL4436 TaxID=3159891 RepID=UPI00397E1AF3
SNTDASPITGVSLTEDLSKCFTAPAEYSIVTGPSASAGSLVVNSSFNGVTQLNLLNPASSSLAAGAKDTIRFVVKVKT